MSYCKHIKHLFMINFLINASCCYSYIFHYFKPHESPDSEHLLKPLESTDCFSKPINQLAVQIWTIFSQADWHISGYDVKFSKSKGYSVNRKSINLKYVESITGEDFRLVFGACQGNVDIPEAGISAADSNPIPDNAGLNRMAIPKFVIRPVELSSYFEFYEHTGPWHEEELDQVNSSVIHPQPFLKWNEQSYPKEKALHKLKKEVDKDKEKLKLELEKEKHEWHEATKTEYFTRCYAFLSESALPKIRSAANANHP